MDDREAPGWADVLPRIILAALLLVFLGCMDINYGAGCPRAAGGSHAKQDAGQGISVKTYGVGCGQDGK